jgi:hypothetical protein
MRACDCVRIDSITASIRSAEVVRTVGTGNLWFSDVFSHGSFSNGHNFVNNRHLHLYICGKRRVWQGLQYTLKTRACTKT